VSVIVSLTKVADEIDSLMEGFTAYLNTQTGELYTLSDDVLDSLDDGSEGDDRPDWEMAERARAIEIRDSEDWLELPSKFDLHEWDLMEKFSLSIDDPLVREDLLNAIRGRGAFRYFKDTVQRHGIRELWFAFKATGIEAVAADWLDEHGIAYHQRDTDSPETAPN